MPATGGHRDGDERDDRGGTVSLSRQMQRLRGWLPAPVPKKGIAPVRWVLLDGNRHAVTGALLTLVFASLVVVGTLQTFEMQRLLTETNSVQTLLNTLMSGIILLVSIVVSINSVVLSYDIASIDRQRERIREAMQFQYDLDALADTREQPTDPIVFLQLMADVIDDRASALQHAVDDGVDEEFATAIQEYSEEVSDRLEEFGEVLDTVETTQFVVLWLGMEYDYGEHMKTAQRLRLTYENQVSDEMESVFDELTTAFELFATGREYFKTLYYGREFSRLSRTLLVVSLPAILVDATTILAIDAGLLPDVVLFGLPPLLTFVAATFTVSLLPFVALTSFTLRAATVANRTLAAGPFVLR